MESLNGPEARISVGSSDVLLLGTIPGFQPDAARVEAAVAAVNPHVIALGVPPEDLEALEAILAKPSLVADLEPDDLDQRFLDLIGEWGDIHAIPSPDLEAASRSGVHMHGVDMDDGHHTGRYTALVKMHHLVQRGMIRTKLEKKNFEHCMDAYELANAWDAQLLKVKPLAALEKEREQHMADGIRDLASKHSHILAVVHAARFAGVRNHLDAND